MHLTNIKTLLSFSMDFIPGTALLQLCSDTIQKCCWVSLMKSYTRLKMQHKSPILSKLFPTLFGSAYK